MFRALCDQGLNEGITQYSIQPGLSTAYHKLWHADCNRTGCCSCPFCPFPCARSPMVKSRVDLEGSGPLFCICVLGQWLKSLDHYDSQVISIFVQKWLPTYFYQYWFLEEPECVGHYQYRTFAVYILHCWICLICTWATVCLHSLITLKLGHTWIKFQLVQQGQAEFWSLYGEAGCTDVDLRSTSVRRSCRL